MRTSFYIILLVLLSACTTVHEKKILAPKVSFSGVQLINMGIFEQTYNIQVDMHNLNDFSLPITRMTYQIYINEIKFASETSNKEFILQAEEIKKIDLLTRGNLLKLAPKLGLELKDINRKNRRKFQYRITGNIYIDSQNSSIPYNQEGEISIAELNESTIKNCLL